MSSGGRSGWARHLILRHEKDQRLPGRLHLCRSIHRMQTAGLSAPFFVLRSMDGKTGKPKLRVLDEPSLGLAPIVVREIGRTLRRLGEGDLTVLLVEQNAKLT